MLRLIVLVKPMIIFMAAAVFLGVLGFMCACSIPILGSAAILSAFGILSFPIKILFVMLIVLGVMRGVLHYGEQACNHYIAFRLLAIIRDISVLYAVFVPQNWKAEIKETLFHS